MKTQEEFYKEIEKYALIYGEVTYRRDEENNIIEVYCPLDYRGE